jgi:UDP-N-acetyl-D-glucosamine dehydrogenase
MTTKEALLKKITSREAVVGVVGLGYVGLPLAVALAEAGFRVIGVDVDSAKVKSLNEGKSYVEDISDNQLMPVVESGHFFATTRYRDISAVDAVSICVPTPLRKTGDPDISFIVDAADNIAALGAIPSPK